MHHDRSTLTTHQWTLLSNIIRCYDEQNVITRVRDYLHEKSSLPVKLRSKSVDTLNLISEPLKCILPLIEHSPDYHQHLSRDARRCLQEQNLFFTGAINGYFVARETDAFHNCTYMTACSALYGYDYMAKCAQDNRRLEANGSLLKLMLFVLIFSSNCSIVFYPGDASSGAVVEEEEEGEDGVGGGRDSSNKRKTNTMKELLGMQDVYVTMLWKYMVYLYGYNQAAVRFSSMIKSVIDMFHRVEELPANPAQNTVMTQCVREMDGSSTLA